jgi:hypothetical protein
MGLGYENVFGRDTTVFFAECRIVNAEARTIVGASNMGSAER